jgi:putative FmdB family regulatory protein
MPTYEYQCTRCNHNFEEFKPISAPRRQRCPSCRGKVELVISGGAGLLFKGSGFYTTDSRGTKSESEPATPAASTVGQDSSAAGTSANDNSNTSQDKT